MKYDPIKSGLGKVFNATPFLRVLFYKLLDLLLLRAWYIRRELRKARKVLGEEARVLDAGSGFGQYSHFMSGLSKGWKIKGIDLKSEQIDDCNSFFTRIKRNGRVTFETADLTKFVEKDSYNLILCVDVMEHILEDEQVFRNYAESTRNNGILLISTPSDQGGSDVHDDHDESFIEEHVRDGYNIGDIEDKLKRSGYTDVDARYSYGIPGKLSWKISMKYPIILLNTSKLFYLIIPVYYLVLYPFAFILNLIDISRRHKSGTGLIVKAVKRITE